MKELLIEIREWMQNNVENYNLDSILSAEIQTFVKRIDEAVKEKPTEECTGRSGCKNAPSDEHTCPFKEEINDDHESLCTCCEACTYECAMDI